MIGCVVDNDVLYKGACYQLLAELLRAVAGDDRCGILGQSRYVVSKKLRKRPPSRGIEAVIAYLEREFEKLDLIEPSRQEIAAAAELEFAAQQLAVALDSGESLLAAVSASRKICDCSPATSVRLRRFSACYSRGWPRWISSSAA